VTGLRQIGEVDDWGGRGLYINVMSLITKGITDGSVIGHMGMMMNNFDGAK
jgi:hypothetical protein